MNDDAKRAHVENFAWVRVIILFYAKITTRTIIINIAIIITTMIE